jgi:hypothetical protein
MRFPGEWGKTLRGAKGDHLKRRGECSHAERRNEIASTWAEKRLWEREESFFENVITDCHLLSFFGR